MVSLKKLVDNELQPRFRPLLIRVRLNPAAPDKQIVFRISSIRNRHLIDKGIESDCALALLVLPLIRSELLIMI